MITISNGCHLIYILIQVIASRARSDDYLIGHREELGKHRPPEGHIDILNQLPTSRIFWDKYASKQKPVLFRGIAKDFPAFSLWTDHYMMEHFGDFKVKIEGKTEKDHYPEGELGLAQDTLRHFLSSYQERNAYIVSQLPDPLAKYILVMPFLNCGTFKERLLEANLWLSSGGTKSLLHRDADNAINCLLNGTKDWVLIDPAFEDLIPIAKEDVEAYGGFSLLNPDSVDLEKYPQFKGVPWWYANMTAGDCLFLPYGYWHQVRSYGTKNMAVSVLFSRLKEVDLEECDQIQPEFIALSDSQMVFRYDGFGDQTMGNTDPFELKETLIEVCQENGKLTAATIHETLLQAYNEFEETDVQPAELDSKINKDISGQMMTILGGSNKGEVSCDVIKGLTLDTMTLLADVMDNDPANTESYEYARYEASDIINLVSAVVEEAYELNDGIVTSQMFIDQYQTIGGSKKVAKEIFSLLNPNDKGELRQEDIQNNLYRVTEKFGKKMKASLTEEHEWTETMNDDPKTLWQEVTEDKWTELRIEDTPIRDELDSHVLDHQPDHEEL